VIPLPPPVSFALGSPFAPAPAPARKGAKDAPRAGQHRWRPTRRHFARLKRAQDALGHLPGPGESAHWLLESFFDPLDITEAIIRAHAAPCGHLRAATLSFSARNVKHLAALIDAGQVRGLTLLCSDWMRDANAKVHKQAVEELRDQRGATVAAARCHAKVSVLDFADGGRFTFEGSGNLSSCRTVEQIMVARDGGLADWHSEWIDRLAGR
jgi:hypothetical protein